MACQQQELGLSDLHGRRETARTGIFIFVRHALIVPALLTLSAPLHAAEPFDFEFSVTNDNNITRAQHSSDVLRDGSLSATLGWGGHKPLGPTTRLLYRVFARGEVWKEYDGLNNATAGTTVTYQYRPSAAFLSPTYGLFAKAAIVEYESELRDSNLYSLGASVRKTLTDRISFSGVLSGNWRDSVSRVFDNSEGSLLLNLDYVLTGRSTLYLTVNALDGDIVSTAVPTLAIVDAAKDIEADDAFGGGAANRFAYRLQARTQVLTLGFNIALAEHHSLDFSARWIDSQTEGDISYRRRQATVAYLARF